MHRRRANVACLWIGPGWGHGRRSVLQELRRACGWSTTSSANAGGAVPLHRQHQVLATRRVDRRSTGSTTRRPDTRNGVRPSTRQITAARARRRGSVAAGVARFGQDDCRDDLRVVRVPVPVPPDLLRRLLPDAACGLRNWPILILSWAFYAWWRVDFLALLVCVTAVHLPDVAHDGGHSGLGSTAGRKLWLVVGLVGNLAVLAYFKYANLGVNSVQCGGHSPSVTSRRWSGRTSSCRPACRSTCCNPSAT